MLLILLLVAISNWLKLVGHFSFLIVKEIKKKQKTAKISIIFILPAKLQIGIAPCVVKKTNTELSPKPFLM